MADVTFERGAIRKRGEWTYAVPGALAMLFALAFVLGVFDANVRAMLPEVLALSGVLALACAFLAWLARGRLRSVVQVGRDRAGAFVRIAGEREVRAPLRYRVGWHQEPVSTTVLPVLWVEVRGDDGPAITMRLTLGAIYRPPADWLAGSPLSPATHELSGIVDYARALDAIGATRATSWLDVAP
ncbi:hypothetical protein [Sandaracinus amylolyticus]|uniref:hypothetical protein n=1 Tax=Sandaracinus amylolyticus TaxID=927083 RepID=UPI001F444A12|nr:hypothetical protein [Sandaracinus amylolyticus]UJR83094.1 Hypothetical protein I5071_51600 [Sandaracinus amylolyticus]